ncbi:MAG: TRAP transporter TatT component family protein [Desulfarculaceae bacterium]|nr:TRAP transporter TatT component family protein [Desulfarculaceae bacterium]
MSRACNYTEKPPAALRLTSLLLALLALCLLASPARSFDKRQLNMRADALYEQRGDLAKAALSAQMYRRLLVEAPDDLEASMRLCELLVWIGAQKPDEQAEEHFRELIAVASAARRAHPQDPGPLFYMGVGQGMLADVASFPEALMLVKQAMKNMAELAASHPGYYYGGPERVLGRIYYKMPGFIGGDNELAEQNYKKAISYGPRYWLNQLYLADLYYQQGKNDQARKLLEEVAQGRPIPALMPECQMWQQLARKALADGRPPN